MNLFDLISGGANGYVQQNFPSDMPPAAPADGMDPLAKLRQLFQGDADVPMNAQPTSGSLPPVPMPRPRPDEAPQAPPQLPTDAITSFAPTDIQRAARGMAPMPTGDGGEGGFPGLLSAIIPNRQDRQRFTSALAGGMSNMTGNTAGAAIGRGLGGALKGSNKFEDDEFGRGVQKMGVATKYLDEMRKARSEGNEVAYKQAQTDYYNALATRAKTAAVDPVTGKASRTPTSAIWNDPRARYDKARRAVLSSDQAIDGDYTLSTQQKAERKQTDAATIYKNYGLNPDGSAPNAPTTPSAKRAGKPDEISFGGDGTQAAPYKPTSKADYDQIEAGTYYVHPSTGQLKLKK